MRRSAGALICVAAIACASVAAAAPRTAGSRPAADTLEGGLWSEADKAERGALASADVEQDAALTAYVRGVACKVAPEYCGDLRFVVMDRPFFNAQVAPNGYAEVWTGLLLRVETEDELAYVLGHEIGHFAENHSLAAHQALKSRMNGALALSFVIGAAGMGAGVASGTQAGMNDAARLAGSISDLVYLGAVASFFQYSRENEIEADAIGFRRAVAQGYDPAAPARVWRNVEAEPAASDFARIRKIEARASLFSTHPITSERVAALDALSHQTAAAHAADRGGYRAIIRPHLGAWLKNDLRRRDTGQSLQLIDRLSALGQDLGLLGFYKGEAYRMRRGEGDLALARNAYLAASVHADCPAAVWRNLGDLALQANDPSAARTAYETYLSRAPSAQDRWLVEASLKRITGPQP